MTDVSNITKRSNPALYADLQDLAEFDTDHIPKHGKGHVALEAEHEGITYRAEAEWDYNHGIEWDYQDVEWYIADPDEPVPCITCGYVEPKPVNLEELDYEGLLKMRYDMNQKLQTVADEIAKREVPIKAALDSGQEVAGFKLKKGRKSRKVKDPKALAKMLEGAGILRTSIYDVKMKGVPDLEKLIRAQFDDEDAEEIYEKHIIETVGKSTLEYVGV